MMFTQRPSRSSGSFLSSPFVTRRLTDEVAEGTVTSQAQASSLTLMRDPVLKANLPTVMITRESLREMSVSCCRLSTLASMEPAERYTLNKRLLTSLANASSSFVAP